MKRRGKREISEKTRRSAISSGEQSNCSATAAPFPFDSTYSEHLVGCVKSVIHNVRRHSVPFFPQSRNGSENEVPSPPTGTTVVLQRGAALPNWMRLYCISLNRALARAKSVAPSIVWEVLHEQQLHPCHLQRVQSLRPADFAPRRVWEQAMCLIGYRMLRNVPYWLGYWFKSKLPGVDSWVDPIMASNTCRDSSWRDHFLIAADISSYAPGRPRCTRSGTLIGSQDLAVKSRPNLFTHSQERQTFLKRQCQCTQLCALVRNGSSEILVHMHLHGLGGLRRRSDRLRVDVSSDKSGRAGSCRRETEVDICMPSRYAPLGSVKAHPRHGHGHKRKTLHARFATPRAMTPVRRRPMQRGGVRLKWEEHDCILIDCSPPTMANQVQSPAGSLPDFRKWESWRTMPLVGGFFLESPGYPHSRIPPLLHFRLISPSSTLETSLLRAAQISQLSQLPPLPLRSLTERCMFVYVVIHGRSSPCPSFSAPKSVVGGVESFWAALNIEVLRADEASECVGGGNVTDPPKKTRMTRRESNLFRLGWEASSLSTTPPRPRSAIGPLEHSGLQTLVLPLSLDYSLLGHAQDGFGPIGNYYREAGPITSKQVERENVSSLLQKPIKMWHLLEHGQELKTAVYNRPQPPKARPDPKVEWDLVSEDDINALKGRSNEGIKSAHFTVNSLYHPKRLPLNYSIYPISSYFQLLWLRNAVRFTSLGRYSPSARGWIGPL
ncbi:hypothetical protein PR048_026228 [Dryococelus australis]|uniref:Uncharacterized protein n=1 Tax=Dryococelus australis TaxID=614101 RepID=A0ABQ9GKR7_9NEOP|nr:hypothetical protein PR048_026228 [Dryococelus australis]